MHRALPALVACASLALVGPSRATEPDVRLQVLPAVVFKVDDPGGSRTSSFVFDVAVLCSADCALTPASAQVELLSGGAVVERQAWTAAMLAGIRWTSFRVDSATPIMAPVRAVALPEAFELRYYVREPRSLAIDSVHLALTVADAQGRRAERVLDIPVRYYHQVTTLDFPIRGNGMIGQDFVTSGGHGGHGDYSDEFGIDIDGLDRTFGELSDADENAADAGWGRAVLAPAAGTVVYARNDVPDNPRPSEHPADAWYRPLHDPVMAAAGNCVIIDHGNAEFSVMMHMQAGSVSVRVGDRVAVGQVVGRLGNSGDAFGPHLHYQLQNGPALWRAQSLPVRFRNLDGPLYRGRFFELK